MLAIRAKIGQFPSRCIVHIDTMTNSIPAFVTYCPIHTPFLRTNPLHNISTRSRRPKPQLQCSTRRRVRASGWRPDVPNRIKQLDEIFKESQRNAEPHEPFPEHVEQYFFKKIPALAETNKAIEDDMAKGDYDSYNGQAFTWAYHKLTPWYPSRLLQLISVVLPIFLVRKLYFVLRARYSLVTIVQALVRFENITNVILLAAVPMILATRLLPISRSDTRTDGVRRSLVMAMLSSIPLMPIAAAAATGNITLALYTGVIVRLGPLAMAFWYWRDLRREIILSPFPRSIAFRIWRMLVSFIVIIGGSSLRIAAICGIKSISIREIMESSAAALRKSAGQSFPIALSLCNDPRGLFFGAGLLLTGLLLYMLYVIMFATEFFSNRIHRSTFTPITSMSIRSGLYQPNVHPEEYFSALPDSEASKAYIPARAMMLTHDDDLLLSDTSMVTAAESMPIEEYLEREYEIMAKEGISEWTKPRGEQIPLVGEMTEYQRAMDGLLLWARPLPDEEANMTFAEYFETLEEDEYVYDPLTENWVFDNPGALNDPATEKNLSSDTTSNGTTPHAEGSDDLTESESFAELEPWIRKMLGNEANKNDDDKDGPSQSIFV